MATLPGEGGGEAFVNYRTAVFNAYYQAWKTPENTATSMAVADVKIVVARNGGFFPPISSPSPGDAAVDHSVQRALDRSNAKIAAFPAQADGHPKNLYHQI